jgi:TM2 domain-containing membrane protein YozV
MNCANHPAAEVAAYCQQCGKPMCSECMRSVGGMVYCEPCLAARLGIPIAGQTTAGGQAPVAPLPPAQPTPMLAGLLGFIPGVGAMYNGQFVKALAHVLIFAVFVSLSDRSDFFGILVAAWVLYQVFDAYHTAKARLEGLPLPDPFGLNDLGTRLGISHASAAPASNAGFVRDATPPAPPVEPSGTTVPANGTIVSANGSKAPVGAIVLIVVGLFLLFKTLGILQEEWLDRCWPLAVIGVGAWLLYRRTHETPGGGPQ